MIHHCNKEIQKNDDVDQREASEHDEAPEPCELFDASQLKIVQVNEPKSCPEQSLWSFP